MVLQQILKDAHVFLFREDRIIGFDAIFLEHGLISVGWSNRNVKSLNTIKGEIFRTLEGFTDPSPWISMRW